MRGIHGILREPVEIKRGGSMNNTGRIRFSGKILMVLILFVFLMDSHLMAAPTVQVEWRVISASHREGAVDPRLKDIYRDLGTIFNYGSYRLVAMNRVALSSNKEVSVPLTGDEAFVIRITEITPRWVHAQIHLLKNGHSIFGTSVQMMKARTLFIGGPTDHGKALIFSLRSFW